MNPRKYALIGGIIMLAMGVLALIPSFSQFKNPSLIPIDVTLSYGMFAGLFPMNVLNKIALILFGIFGITAANATNISLSMSIWWSRAVLFVMGFAAILGIIPQTKTLFGFWPLYGAEIWLHGAFAVLGAIFGYALPAKAGKNDQVKMAGMPQYG